MLVYTVQQSEYAVSQFSSVTQLCLTLGDYVDCSTPGFPVHHQLLEFVRFIPIESVMLTISSSATSFSFYLPSFPPSGSFLMSQLFASGGQSIGVSASASVLPVNIQDWFPSGLIVLISLQAKGLSRVFSSTTIWRHQFLGTQPFLWSSSHICAWWLETP